MAQQEEYLLRLQMLEQQANQFEEQLQAINQQISELTILDANIEHFEKSKQKEIFTEFGKGIFIRAEAEKKEFLIDVGSKIYVKKTAKEIQEIIKQQIDKFESVKPEIAKRTELINNELTKLVEQAKNENDDEDNKSESKKSIKKEAVVKEENKMIKSVKK